MFDSSVLVSAALDSTGDGGLALFAAKHTHTITPTKPAATPMPAICGPLRRGDSGSIC
jgi:hypothetical protein